MKKETCYCWTIEQLTIFYSKSISWKICFRRPHGSSRKPTILVCTKQQEIFDNNFPNKNQRIARLIFPLLTYNSSSENLVNRRFSIMLHHYCFGHHWEEYTRIWCCSLDTHTTSYISGIPQPGHVSRNSIATFNELERNSRGWSTLSILY